MTSSIRYRLHGPRIDHPSSSPWPRTPCAARRASSLASPITGRSPGASRATLLPRAPNSPSPTKAKLLNAESSRSQRKPVPPSSYRLMSPTKNRQRPCSRPSKDEWGQLDFLVHSVAYADRNDLKGRTVDTSKEGFLKALEISAYSLISLTRAAEPLLRPGGSIIAMTYYGAVKVAPSYNVMGIAKAALESSVRYLAADLGPNQVRVNALSAGPIKTLAASGVSLGSAPSLDTPQSAPLSNAT